MSRRIQAALPTIRRMLAAGIPQGEIARKVSVSWATVHRAAQAEKPSCKTDSAETAPAGCDLLANPSFSERLDGLYHKGRGKRAAYHAAIQAWVATGADINATTVRSAEILEPCGVCTSTDMDRSPCPHAVTRGAASAFDAAFDAWASRSAA